jgi:hypothetical protein
LTAAGFWKCIVRSRRGEDTAPYQRSVFLAFVGHNKKLIVCNDGVVDALAMYHIKRAGDFKLVVL